MSPKSLFTCPMFFNTLWHWQSHLPFVKTDFASSLALTIFYLDHHWCRKEVCTLKSQQRRDRRARGRHENGEIPREAWLSAGPSATCLDMEYQERQSLGNQPLGVFPSLSQLDSISVSISHQLVFQQNTSASPPKTLPLEGLIKIITPGLCFCPSLSLLNRETS